MFISNNNFISNKLSYKSQNNLKPRNTELTLQDLAPYRNNAVNSATNYDIRLIDGSGQKFEIQAVYPESQDKNPIQVQAWRLAGSNGYEGRKNLNLIFNKDGVCTNYQQIKLVPANETDSSK